MRSFEAGIMAYCAAAMVVSMAVAGIAMAQTTASVATMEEAFKNPPAAARPMVRWWWFGPAVTKPEILRELQQMKSDGIGGAEFAFVYPEELDDPGRGIKNLVFLSPEHLAAVNYAQAEGRKLGLRIDVTLCSGWPYGGRHTPLSEAAGRLRDMEVPIAPGATSVTPPIPLEGDTFLNAFVVNGTLARWTAAGAQPLDATRLAIHRSGVQRVAVFFYASHTRQQVKRAAVGAEGYVLDPFSRQAVATHLEKVGTPLINAFGATPPYAIFSDSLEAYGADWTPDLPQEFRKRRGYDLLPHLPELYAGGTPEAEKVRHDWGLTLKELVDENYLTQINDWAKVHHTKFRSQTYGTPAVSFSSQRLAALPEGEGPQWRAFSTLRWATSANHVYGNDITSGETFTWLHSPVFRATPLDMKAEADIDFIMGENQFVFHGWPYSPPQADIKPGWSLYAAAVFNNTNPWHPVMPAVDAYITRLSYVLRQGEPANQVAILLPTDDAQASFSPGRVSVTAAMQTLLPHDMIGAVLSAGYNFDFTDADAIKAVGVRHPVLVLPPTDRIPLATMQELEAYTAHGGKLIAVGRTPTLEADGTPSAQVAALSRKLFTTVVSDSAQIGDALHVALPPDLTFAPGFDAADAVGFIRRKLTDADVYFVVNTSNRAIDTSISLTTTYRSGRMLDPETGEPSQRLVSPQHLALHLAPYGSALYIFDSTKPAADITPSKTQAASLPDLQRGWTITFTGTGKVLHEAQLEDWTADPSTLHYSGEAVYTKSFTLSSLPHGRIALVIDGGQAQPGAPNSPPEPGAHEAPALGPDGLPNPLITRPGPGMHAWFDPPVRAAAIVEVNGKPAGSLWHPPYRLDITKLLQDGDNSITIHVYNTAMNAWSALPPHNYQPLIEKYGDRFQMQDLDKVKPVPSGITGTVRLTITEKP